MNVLSTSSAANEFDQDTTDFKTPSIPNALVFVSPIAKKSKDDVTALLAAITAVNVPEDCPVYANCDEVRHKIEQFLCHSGVNQSRFLATIGVAGNSLASFRKLNGKGAGASNCVYPKAWRFFEQKRILEEKPKSAKHIEQEKRWGPKGFPLEHDSGRRWVRKDCTPEERAKFFDIEVTRLLMCYSMQ